MARAASRRPRLSGYIRAYGNVSFKYEQPEDAAPVAPRQREGAWQGVVSLLPGREGVVRRLRALVLEVVGSESTPGQADTACLHLLQTLLREKKLGVTVMRGLKRQYGGISQAQAEKVLVTVQELVEGVGEEVLARVARGGQVEEEQGPMFGANIQFTAPTTEAEDRLDLSYLAEVVDSLPSQSSLAALSFLPGSLPPPPRPPSAGSGEPALHTGWLEDTLARFYTQELPLGLSIPEFAVTILELLASKRSSEDLQTELFDLCGFDRFDMIGVLLEKREALVKSLKQNKVEMRAELSRAAASLAQENLGQSKPNFGCQVSGELGTLGYVCQAARGAVTPV